MGQKANPIGVRIGISRDWDSTWFAQKDYGSMLMQDHQIRTYIREQLKRAGVSKIRIKRKSDRLDIEVFVGRPGVIFGKNGLDLSFYQEELKQMLGRVVHIHIIEEKNPQNNAKLVSEVVVSQLEKRIPFRRAMKIAVQMALKSGANGIKVSCSGRLGGVEIARTEWYLEGKVPLQTFRANIDYALSEALTTYGKIGVKVWIYNEEVRNRPNKVVGTTLGEPVTAGA